MLKYQFNVEIEYKKSIFLMPKSSIFCLVQNFYMQSIVQSKIREKDFYTTAKNRKSGNKKNSYKE